MAGFIPDQYKVSPAKTAEKQESLSKAGAEKKLRLATINPNIDLTDGDSLNAALLGVEQGNYLNTETGQVQDDTRFMSGVTGEAFDAAETFHKGKPIDPSRGARQLRVLANQRGVPVESLSLQDLFDEGEKTKGLLADFLREGQEDPNAVEAYLGNTGQGYYGRAGLSPTNAVTEKNFLEQYRDNPDVNLSYYSRYNDAGRNRVEAAKQALRADNEATNIISDENAESFLGGAANTLISAGTTFASIPLSGVQAVTDILDSAADNFLPEEVSNITSVPLEALSGELSTMTGFLESLVNDKGQTVLNEQVGDDVAEMFTSVAAGIDQWEAGDQLGASIQISKSIANVLGDTVKAGIDNPGGLMPIIGQSIAYVKSLAKQGALGVLNKAGGVKEVYEPIQEDFERINGREMTTEEKIKAGAAAVAVTMLDFVSGKYVLRPFIGKTDEAAELAKATKKIQKRVETVVKRNTKTKKVAGAIKDAATSKIVTAPGRGAAAEFPTEGLQGVLEQYGTKQDITKIDPQAAVVEGLIGGLAGGTTSAGVDTAAPLLGKTIKGAVTGVKKIDEKTGFSEKRQKIKDAKEKTKAGFSERVDPKYKHFDPDDAMDATSTEFAKDGATYATQGEAINAFVEKTLPELRRRTGEAAKAYQKFLEDGPAAFEGDVEKWEAENKRLNDEFDQAKADVDKANNLITSLKKNRIKRPVENATEGESSNEQETRDPDTFDPAEQESPPLDSYDEVADPKDTRTPDQRATDFVDEAVDIDNDMFGSEETSKNLDKIVNDTTLSEETREQAKAAQEIHTAFADYAANQNKTVSQVKEEILNKREGKRPSIAEYRARALKAFKAGDMAGVQKQVNELRRWAKTQAAKQKAWAAAAKLPAGSKFSYEILDANGKPKTVERTVYNRAASMDKVAATMKDELGLIHAQANFLQSKANQGKNKNESKEKKLNFLKDLKRRQDGTVTAAQKAVITNITRELIGLGVPMGDIANAARIKASVLRRWTGIKKPTSGTQDQETSQGSSQDPTPPTSEQETEDPSPDIPEDSDEDFESDLEGNLHPEKENGPVNDTPSTPVEPAFMESEETDVVIREARNSVRRLLLSLNFRFLNEEDAPSLETLERIASKYLIGKHNDDPVFLADAAKALSYALYHELELPEGSKTTRQWVEDSLLEWLQTGKEPKVDKKLWVQLLQAFDKLIAAFSGKEYKQIERKLEETIDKIKTNQDFSYRPKDGFEVLNFQKEMNNNPSAVTVLTSLSVSGIPYALTGSVAYADQVPVYRKEGKPLHDVDLLLTAENVEKALEHFKNGDPKSFGDVTTLYSFSPEGRKVIGIAVVPAGYEIRNTNSGWNIKLKAPYRNYEVYDKATNEKVGSYDFIRGSHETFEGIAGVTVDLMEDPRQNTIPQSFNDAQGKNHTIQVANYIGGFTAKLNMLRYKDINDFLAVVPPDIKTESTQQETDVEEEVSTVNVVPDDSTESAKKVMGELSSLDEVTAYIRQYTDNRFYNVILNRILPFINPDIEIIQKKDPNKASGSTRTVKVGNTVKPKFIIINTASDHMQGRNASYFAEVLLHELVHAATTSITYSLANKVNLDSFTDQQKRAFVRLNLMFNQVSKHYNADTKLDGYTKQVVKGSMKNLEEFLTISLTNTHMQEYLKGIKPPVSFGTHLKNTWSAFTKSILDLLGLPVAANPALAEILDAANAMIPGAEIIVTESVTPVEDGGAVVDSESSQKAAKSTIPTDEELEEDLEDDLDSMLDGTVHNTQNTQQKDPEETPEENQNTDDEVDPEGMQGVVVEDEDAFVDNTADLARTNAEERRAEAKRNPEAKVLTIREQAQELLATLSFLDLTAESDVFDAEYQNLESILQDSDRDPAELITANNEAREVIADHTRIEPKVYVDLKNAANKPIYNDGSNRNEVNKAKRIYHLFRTLAQASYTNPDAIAQRQQIFDSLKEIISKPEEAIQEIFSEFYVSYGHANPAKGIIENGQVNFNTASQQIDEDTEVKESARPDNVEDIKASDYLGQTPHSKGPLGKISNFFAHYLSKIGKKEIHARYALNKHRTDEQIAANNEFPDTDMLNKIATDFIPKFIAALERSVAVSRTESKSAEFRNKHEWYEFDETAVHILRDENGDLDPNAVSAMAIAALNYVITNHRNMLQKNREDMNAIMDRDKDTGITPEVYDLLAFAGVNMKTAQMDVGTSVRQQLGIRVLDNKDGRLEPKLDLSLGQLAMHALQDMHLVQYNTLEQRELQKARFDYEKKKLADQHTAMVNAGIPIPEGQTEEGINPDAQMHFISVRYGSITKTDEGYKVKGKTGLGRALANYYDNRKLFGRMFGLVSFERSPEEQARDKQNIKVKNTVTQPSDINQKGLKAANKLEWFGKEQMMNVFKSLSPEIALAIAGVVTDFTGKHFTEDETIEAQNASFEKEYRDAVDFLVQRGYDVAHHYPQAQYRNGRNGPSTNTVNPQSSKIHRFLVAPLSWTKTIPIVGKGHRLGVRKLKIAMMAGFGMEADKNSFSSMVLTFNRDIYDGKNILDPDIAAAVEVLRKIKKNPEGKLTPSEQKAILTGVQTKKAGEKFLSLDALVTLRDYVDAVESGATEVTASIPREIDGVTNGLIGMVMQFAPGGEAMRRILRAGGIRFKDDPVVPGGHSYDKRVARPGTRDNYQELGMNVINNFSSVEARNTRGITSTTKHKKSFFQHSEAMVTATKANLGVLVDYSKWNEENVKAGTAEIIVTKLARTLFKYPVMYSSYGQAIQGILATLLNDLVVKLHTDVMEAETPQEFSDILYNQQLLYFHGVQRRRYEREARIAKAQNRENTHTVPGLSPEMSQKFRARADALAKEHFDERRYFSFPKHLFNSVAKYEKAHESQRERLFANDFKEFMGFELAPIVREGVDTLLGGTKYKLDTVNAAFRVSSEIFAAYWAQFIKNHAEKNNGDYPSKKLQQEEFQRLVKSGVVPMIPHASSVRADHKDSIQVTDMAKVELENTTSRFYSTKEGGIEFFKLQIDTSSGRSKRVNMFLLNEDGTPKLDANGRRIRNEDLIVKQNSLGDVATIKAYIGDIGQKGGVSMIHSLDGNVQTHIMKMFEILNLHDAQMSNFMDIDAQAIEQNSAWYGYNKNWSVFEQINTQLERSMSALAQGAKYLDPEIKKNLHAIVDGYLIDAEIAESMDNFINTVFPAALADVQEGRKDLFEGEGAITDVSNYPSEDANYQPNPEDDLIFGAPKADFEKSIDEAVEYDIVLLTRSNFVVKRDSKQIVFKSTLFNDTFNGPAEIEMFLTNTSAGYVVEYDGNALTEPVSTQTAAIDQLGMVIRDMGGIRSAGQIIRSDAFRHGSVSDGRTGFNEVYNKLLTSDAVSQIFDDLAKHPLANINITENTPENAEHVATLKKLIKEWAVPALLKIDEINLHVGTTEAESNRGEQFKDKIYVKATEGILQSQTDMSMQEVMVHELVHAIWSEMIDTNPRIRAELKKLFNIARNSKDISYKNFLKYDSNGQIITARNTGNQTLDEAYEIKEAKSRYDYIFNSTKGYLHEFAAFGLTNESFMAALAGVKNKSERSLEGSLFDKLVNIFLKFTDFIFRSRYKGTGATLDVALRNLANSVNNVRNQNKSKLDDFWDAFYSVNQKFKNVILSQAVKPVVKWTLDTVVDPDAGKVKKNFAKIIGLATLPGNKHFREATNRMMYGLGYTMDNPGYKLLDEMAGAHKVNQSYHNMLRNFKHTIDQTVQAIATNNTKWIFDYFDPKVKLTNQQWEDINTALMKTDLGFLAEKGFSVADILELLTNQKAVDTTIAKRDDQLRKDYGDQNGYYYINQSQNLGGIMATGQSGLEEGLMSVHAIAHLANLQHQAKVGNKVIEIGNLEQAEIDVSILATLNAIKNTSMTARKSLAKIMSHEYARDPDNNGIAAMFKMHSDFKKDSLRENFGGNRTLLVKGYTHEMYDQYRSMKVGVKADEAAMRDAGYIPKGEITRDHNGTLKTPMVVYVANTGLMSSRVSGIFSFMSKISKGEDLVEQMLSLTDQAVGKKVRSEFNKVRSNNAHKVKNQFTRKLKLNYENNYMIPILSPTTGSAVNYRYTMSEQNKKEFLGKRDLAHKVLGRMIASAYNKQVTEDGNIEFFKLAHTDFKNNFHKNPRVFIEISPTAKNPKHREYYAMMPEHAKIAAKAIWGLNSNGDPQPIMVREDILDLVFGFNKASFTTWLDTKFKKLGGLPYFMKQIMRHTGIIWQTIIKRVKENVVLFIPTVLMNNMISNTILLILSGVNPVNAFKYQKESYVALAAYQQDHKKLLRLEHAIKTFPNHPETQNRIVKANHLREDIKRNPIKKFIDQGLYQAIVEDIEIDNDDTVIGVVARSLGVEDKSEIYGEMIPKIIKEGFKQFTVAPDTKLAGFMVNATAYSDFAGRYALYKHLTTRKRNPMKEVNGINQEAIEIVVDTFINYDIPTSPLMQWANDMGVVMFTKYLLRIQRIIFRLFRDAPMTTVLAMMVADTVGDPAMIMDSNIVGEDVLGRLEIPLVSGERWGTFFNANFLRLFGWMPGVNNSEGFAI